MAERVEVSPGIFAERTDPHNMQYTKVHDDGSESVVNMYVFSKEQIDELRSHLPAAYAKCRESSMKETWIGRLRLRWERLIRFDAKSLYE